MNRRSTTAVAEPRAVTWESLHDGGDKRLGRVACWFGLHPLTNKQVEVTYDIETGQTTSRPRCPELEAVAREATLVRERHAAVRGLRLDPGALEDLAARARADLEANADDEAARVLLCAVRLELRKRRLLGDAIGEAQRAGGDVRAIIDRDLFGFSEGGC